MKYTDYEAYLLQKQREAEQWYATYGKKYGLLPVSNQNLIKALASASELIDHIPHTDGLVSQTIDRKWLLGKVADCTNALEVYSQAEKNMFGCVVVDALDFNREKPSSFGLCDIPNHKHDTEAYEDLFECRFDFDLFTQFRNHVQNNCSIIGLGAASTAEYHDLLVRTNVNRSISFGKVVCVAKEALLKFKSGKTSFIPSWVPKGPLDTRCFTGLKNNFWEAS